MSIKDILLIPVILVAALFSDGISLVFWIFAGTIVYCVGGGIVLTLWDYVQQIF